jgi:ribosomal protein S18 acetylase RimI-like enzyme
MNSQLREETRSNTNFISLRPVSPDDEPFLLRVYASARADELVATGLDTASLEAFLRMQFTAQKLAYGAQFPNADHRIILRDELMIGRMLVDRRDDEIYLVDIIVLAEHRGEGTGTSLIRDLQREATDAGRPVRLRVMKTNRAVSFYERLGFSKIDESSTHFLMEWLPGA